MFSESNTLSDFMTRHGFDVNHLNKVNHTGVTPLTEAIYRRNVEVTTLLISKGANPFIENMHENTPLKLALEQLSTTGQSTPLSNLIHKAIRVRTCDTLECFENSTFEYGSKKYKIEKIIRSGSDSLIGLEIVDLETNLKAFLKIKSEFRGITLRNYTTLDKYIDLFSIDTLHLNGKIINHVYGLIQTFVPGIPLSKVLIDCEEEEIEKKKFIAKKAIQALCKLHAKNFMHNDSLPDNCHWDQEKQNIEFLDFDFSETIAPNEKDEKIFKDLSNLILGYDDCLGLCAYVNDISAVVREFDEQDIPQNIKESLLKALENKKQKFYRVLHVALEYKYGIGGLKAVLNGLLPALKQEGVNASVVTPYYDFIHYDDFDIEHIGTVYHIYKGEKHASVIYRANSLAQPTAEKPVFHYLIKPVENSPVARIFEVGSESKIYHAFDHSEPQNRVEYFNGAVASLVRTINMGIPEFDLVHTHCWQTALSNCLIKEFENLKGKQVGSFLGYNRFQKIPKVVSNIHMLSHEQGLITATESQNIFNSVGISTRPDLLDANNCLNQTRLSMQYSDQVILVSEGLIKDIFRGNHCGLGPYFTALQNEGKLGFVTNGINIKSWHATLPENLKDKTLASGSIMAGKMALKKFLLSKFPELKIDTPWFLYVGRFSSEKGIDMLVHAHEAIKQLSGQFIVMGIHSSQTPSQDIERLKGIDNILVIDTKEVQAEFGKYFRAASEFTIVPSHVEACGLVPMEAMANASIPITSNVQGLPDTVISLLDDSENGTGFIYDNTPSTRIQNLQKSIIDANGFMKQLASNGKLDSFLSKILENAWSYDWSRLPTANYIKKYEVTLKASPKSSHHEIFKNDVAPTMLPLYAIQCATSEKTPGTAHGTIPAKNHDLNVIKVLHIALEYGKATLGGLGTVTTQMVDAQNKFGQQKKFIASIITPYYQGLYKHLSKELIATVKHLYNNETVESYIYLSTEGGNNHYMVDTNQKFKGLFNLHFVNHLYTDSESGFLERFKYFNAAVAAYVNNPSIGIQHPDPFVLQLHDWTTSLVPLLLQNVYKNQKIKSAFMMHIDLADKGAYDSHLFSGMGLTFQKERVVLKQVGLENSDTVIAVSPGFLKSCESTKQTNHEAESVRRTLLKLKAIQKPHTKSHAILNGFNRSKYCPIGSLIPNDTNVSASKKAIKQQLAKLLQGARTTWKIDTNLPVILYVGRYSPEKGVESFESLIQAINGRAIFFAIGRGLTNEVLEVVKKYSRRKDNVFVTFSEDEQRQYGDLMRASADFFFVPSHREACGLVPMEGFSTGALCITSGIGGLQDTVTPISTIDQGNGFLYEDNNQQSFAETINKALQFWENLSETKKSQVHFRILEESKKLDWSSENGSLDQYWNIFHTILNPAPTNTCKKESTISSLSSVFI